MSSFKLFEKEDGRKVFGVKNNKQSALGLGGTTDKSNKHNFLLRSPGMHPAGHEIQNGAGAHLNITK